MQKPGRVIRTLSLTRKARYGIAVFSVALAAIIRLALEPVLGADLPLAFFSFAVLVTSWCGGLGPGLLATALSALIGDYLFLEPIYSIFHFSDLYNRNIFVFFVITGTIFSLLNSWLRNSVKAEHESAEAFRLLVEGVRDYAIFMIDPEGRVASWTPAAERVTGYTSDEIIGRDFLTLCTPEQIESGRPQRGLEIAAAEGCYEEEDWRIRKDGSRFWASILTTPLRDDSGQLRGFARVARDITERKIVDDALRESQRFAQQIFEVSPSVIYIYDTRRRETVFVNRSIVDELGYDPAQGAQGEEFARSLMHPDDLQSFLTFLNRTADLRDDETSTFECRMLHSSGDWYWIHSRNKVFARNEDGSVREIIGTATDITERKHAEENAKFINILNQAIQPLVDPEEIKGAAARILGEYLGADRCAYAEIEADGNYLEITCDYTRGETPSIVGRFGVDDLGPDVLRLMRMNLPSVVNDIEAEASTKHDLTAFRLAEIQAMVCAPIMKEGHFVARMSVQQKTPRRWLSEEVELIKIVANRCWESVARARAFRKVREGEKRLRRITDATNDALWEINLRTRRLWWSEGARPLFGYSPGELEIGLEEWYEGIHPEDVDSVNAKFETFMRSDDPDWIDEYRFRRADGSYVYIQDRGRKFFDERGTPVLVAGAMVDITERKRAEEAMRASEENALRQLAYVEAIYATAPVGLCFVDTEQRFLSINKHLAEITGKTVEEHLGHTVREVLPGLADKIEPRYRRVIETGKPILNVEMSGAMDYQPGVVRHFILSYYPIKNYDGQVLGVNGVLVEITERRNFEEELERLLQQEKMARAEAEVANRMKDEFLATISHELRTPLTSILGWARMLTSGSLSEPKARHAMEVIDKCAKSQTRLVDDILDASRIIAGSFALDAKPVEIERIFQAAVDVIRPSAEVKGVALTAVIDVQGDLVFGEASRLQQAIWNMLSNAVKFTDEGGRIEARLSRAGNQIEITVSDTGIGIEPQFLPYVFERFRQADSSSTRKYGGLGLGLTIAHHIIELHSGSISASSPGRNQGATFIIRLPLAMTSRAAQAGKRRLESEAPETKGRKGSEERQMLDGVRILLVEDDPDTLDMLKTIFDECGAEVITAASASEALEALERYRPDALVSDIAMPNQDGYDLIRQVRSRGPEQGGKIPAVAVTAYASAEDRMRVLASGYQIHVSKPVDPGELIATVASLTGHIHF
jgi:PAS domain S-box-containing protein